MQLYKSRGFGEFFQDTFAFLKLNGSHLFKNFFIVNGIFLLILLVLGYFSTKFYSDVVLGGILNGNTAGIDNYMNENAGLFVIFIVTFVIMGLFAGIIAYAYVPIYMQLYAAHEGNSFGVKEIVNTYKANIGNIFIFLLCGIVVAIPMVIIVGIMAVVLTITIVGILALPLLVGAVSLFYQMTLMEYIKNEKGIWECFGYSWTLIVSKFWAAISCVGLFYLMSYIVQNIIAFIPYIFGMVSLFTEVEDGNSPNSAELGATMTVMMMAVFFLTFLVSSVLNVVLQSNQALIFYSLKEDIENINTKSVIDQIGAGE
ncbi:hypothetical protein ESY86_15935 [Subsaximicrobium wynnwilliamsii]|uniref:Glycerophosphoryl diester phosphodiesterase membrane domain-containing protein n=1 Tax=Subsaximicrobium wynnwilliamsii TaxID=291179 RepID=A0A5C6ZCC1_9FLAO|nr:hypothetical protein [Subsaximicrobium wynnwilliamsii]TXD81952.1 hypothetical protein ESY87_15915 [Subsaximicrobium wynnwilliamsii]TXD87650.1 hypothetical protein ESY86_15935 [Subsaximicrobium wynnwilliamsii]TXE01397.1 hypothetical protein ESY88_15905 [Subsaximicrobium wynnwilliamsii]